MEFQKFQCKKCGLCCTMFHHPEFPKDEKIQKYSDQNGICKLFSDNLCTNYENRPLFCNSTKMYEKIFQHHMTEAEYDDFVAEHCFKVRNVWRSKDERLCENKQGE